jgi:CheY-like chemotaxis protein
VRVHLPTYRGIARAEPTAETDAPAPPTASPARRRVLVIDDEAMICRAIEQVLSDNHDVQIAMTGADALALVASSTFDVILCDVMMPDMNGHQLYRRIAAQYPGLERRFVFMTGALAPAIAKALEDLPNPWLAKPFQVEQVLALVDQALVT